MSDPADKLEHMAAQGFVSREASDAEVRRAPACSKGIPEAGRPVTYGSSRDETHRQLGIMLAVLALAVTNVLVFPSLLPLTVLGASILLMGSGLVGQPAAKRGHALPGGEAGP